jgi:hypothetical protein
MRQGLYELSELSDAAMLAHAMMQMTSMNGPVKNGRMLAAAAWIAAYVLGQSESGDERTIIYEQFLLTLADIMEQVDKVEGTT